MKKFLSFAIVIMLMMGLCVSAFAAGSPQPQPTDPQTEPIVIIDPSNPEQNITIPANAVKMVTIDKADILLNEEDAKTFKAAYEDAQKLEDVKVYKCYWLYVDEKLAGKDFKGIDENNVLPFKFTCPGEDVKLFVNNHEMKVVHDRGISYIAHLTETGTVTITCAK